MLINRQVQWGIVLVITLAAVVSRLRFNGLIFDFDYGIYQPDGSHYAYRTLTFLGVDSNAAAEKVVNWYQIHGIKNNIFSPSFLTPENAEIWGVVAPRVFYSFLSIPFVYLFGLSGMLAIPIVAFTLLVFCVFRMSEIKGKQAIGLLLVLVLCTSPTVLRWMVANITDSLLTGLFTVTAMLLMSKVSGVYWYSAMSGLVVLTSMTRFSLPIWLGIAFVLWFNKMRFQSIWVSILSALFFLPTFVYLPDNAVLPANSDAGLLSKLILLIGSFFKIGFIEIAQLGALDRILLVTLIVAVAISLRQIREISSQYFLSVLVSVWTIGAINGTLGVNFRYQLPVLGFACWVILSNPTPFADWFGGRRINVVGKEA